MARSSVSTYALLSPVVGVPDDVITALMSVAQELRYHSLVLGEPNLELLVPAPVARVARMASVAVST